MGAEKISARAVAEAVTDPELPMLTLADLGILREVREDGDAVTVAITPTYSGCPALDTMRDDLVHALRRAGYGKVEVRTVLTPPWTTDWISAAGRRKLAAAGIAPPGTAPQQRTGGRTTLWQREREDREGISRIAAAGGCAAPGYGSAYPVRQPNAHAWLRRYGPRGGLAAY